MNNCNGPYVTSAAKRSQQYRGYGGRDTGKNTPLPLNIACLDIQRYPHLCLKKKKLDINV